MNYHPNQVVRPERIAVVGVGGAGGQIVQRLTVGMATGPLVAVVDTDADAMAVSGVAGKVPIGAYLTHGLGTGGDPKVGRLAAEAEFMVLCQLLEKRELVLVIAGLGGGVGAGATPVIARAAHEQNALVLALAVLPFDFEGAAIRRRAEDALVELCDAADAVVVIPNQRLFGLVGVSSPAAQVLARANEILAQALTGLWRAVVHRGLMNLTFADLRAVSQRGRGMMVFGYGQADGADRAQRAAQAALQSPLLENGAVLARAGTILVNIAGGPEVTFGEIEQIMTAVTAASPDRASIRMAPALDPALGEALTVILFVDEWAGPGVGTAGDGPVKAAVDPDRSTEDNRNSPSEPQGSAGRLRQAQLRFDVAGTGRFKNVEPTIHKGENLDVPSYQRRGLVLEK